MHHLQGCETEKLPHQFHRELACPVGFSGEILKKNAGRVSVDKRCAGPISSGMSTTKTCVSRAAFSIRSRCSKYL